MSLSKKLAEYRKKYKYSAVIDEIKAILEKHPEAVEDANIAQMWKGKDSDNDRIYPLSPRPSTLPSGYTSYTTKLKQLRGQPTDRVTLKDDGDFYRSVYVIFKANHLELWAKDRKTMKLSLKYGREIFGLTQDSIIELSNETIAPELMKWFKP